MIDTFEYDIVRLKYANGIRYNRFKLDGRSDANWGVDHVCTLVDLKDYRFFWFEHVKTTRTVGDSLVCASLISFRSEVLHTSPKFFVNAYVETCEDVMVNNRELAERMVGLNWTHIARSIDIENYWTEHFVDGEDVLLETK